RRLHAGGRPVGPGDDRPAAGGSAGPAARGRGWTDDRSLARTICVDRTRPCGAPAPRGRSALALTGRLRTANVPPAWTGAGRAVVARPRRHGSFRPGRPPCGEGFSR